MNNEPTSIAPGRIEQTVVVEVRLPDREKIALWLERCRNRSMTSCSRTKTPANIAVSPRETTLRGKRDG